MDRTAALFRAFLLLLVSWGAAACANSSPALLDSDSATKASGHINLAQWKRLHPPAGAVITSSRTGGMPSQDLQWEFYVFRVFPDPATPSVYYWDVERAVGALDNSSPTLSRFDSRSCQDILALLPRVESIVAPSFKIPTPPANGLLEPAGPAPDGNEYVLSWTRSSGDFGESTSAVSVTADSGEIAQFHRAIAEQLGRCKPT